ncbi:uncharacterized protein N7477_002059 [Penicillium maclennaniae]|uniref:uncharacterized protein n=1 Tax=Penicillium maclennaniae TaxID=1343394 RepID=UPI0025418437|nr:uncharacterized protein N7477_002059 [Penicillium maclennaniae]KAJ5682119.1 hypothetical protein N7477_002059 [Penicillium maclennaniae]
MPSPTYDQSEHPPSCQTKFKTYPPSIATSSIDTGSSSPSYKEGDIEYVSREDGLPPIDGGKQAWLFLIASAMLEALVWETGYAFSFGIFQDYYSAHDPFRGSANIAVIGTCAMGIAYLIAPLAIVVMIMVPALLVGSFSTNVTHLILSQGIGFGVGGCLSYTPSILFMSEWFCKRKGLAFGIVWAGSGLSGVIFPLVIQWLLNHYGIKSTLRISAVALFILAAPFLYSHKPRLPIRESVCHRRLSFTFLYSKVYIIYQLGNTIEALGFFLPTIYLPTYARSLGASEFMSSLTVTLFNLTSVFSCVVVGFLSDRYHITTCILVLTHTVYSLVDTRQRGQAFPTRSSEKNPEADATVIFPFMETGRGIGNLVSGPLSEVLLKADHWKGRAWGAYGSGFGTLVVCTGATALVGGISVVARQMKWL